MFDTSMIKKDTTMFIKTYFEYMARKSRRKVTGVWR